MAIYKLSRVIAFPFGLILIWFLYKAYQDSSYEDITWTFIPILVLVLIYLFQPQIDYWWLSKFPIQIDKKLLDIIEAINPIIKNLDEEEKKRFEKRLFLHVEAKAFISKGSEDGNVPYDIKHLLSQIPVTMTFHQEDFLLKGFDRIVLYKHPFPTPRFDFLHTYETHAEDGVIIMSFEQIEKGLFASHENYNVAWHAYSEAFVKSNPGQDYPEVDDTTWIRFEKICGFSKDQILATLGFENIDPLPLLIVGYFNYKEKFEKEFSREYLKLKTIFNNPTAGQE